MVNTFILIVLSIYYFLYEADVLSWFYYNLDSLWDTSRVVHLCINAYIFIHGLLIILLIKLHHFYFAAIFLLKIVLQFWSCCKLSYHWLLINVNIYQQQQWMELQYSVSINGALSWQASLSIHHIGVGLYSKKKYWDTSIFRNM